MRQTTENHRAIRQWLVERQRELARNRVAQAARRRARADGLRVASPDDDRREGTMPLSSVARDTHGAATSSRTA